MNWMPPRISNEVAFYNYMFRTTVLKCGCEVSEVRYLRPWHYCPLKYKVTVIEDHDEE